MPPHASLEQRHSAACCTLYIGPLAAGRARLRAQMPPAATHLQRGVHVAGVAEVLQARAVVPQPRHVLLVLWQVLHEHLQRRHMSGRVDTCTHLGLARWHPATPVPPLCAGDEVALR